jgi:hypothetical protein
MLFRRLSLGVILARLREGGAKDPDRHRHHRQKNFAVLLIIGILQAE